MDLEGRYEPPTEEVDGELKLDLVEDPFLQRKRRKQAPGKMSRTLAMDALLPQVRERGTERARQSEQARSDAPAGAIQADGGRIRGLDPFAVHLLAREGVSGSGGSLPHLAAIQKAFGHHDVTGVHAHVGGAAADAAAEIGARAYATGDDVAFAGSPDLRQAAHEAAHVVQQRGGVRLDGGVGKSGDTYEQHADAVADLVARGQSAETLLDTMAHRGPSGGPAVQREDLDGDGIDDGPAPGPAADTAAPDLGSWTSFAESFNGYFTDVLHVFGGRLEAAAARDYFTDRQRDALASFISGDPHLIPDRLFNDSTPRAGATRQLTAGQRIMISAHILANGMYRRGSAEETQRMHARMCGHWVNMVNAYAGVAGTSSASGVSGNFDNSGNVVLGAGAGPTSPFANHRAADGEAGTGNATVNLATMPFSRFDELQPGDWLWIYNGRSGGAGNHSVVFSNWVTGRDEGRAPLQYRQAVTYDQLNNESGDGGRQHTIRLGGTYDRGQRIKSITRVERAREDARPATTVEELLPDVREPGDDTGPAPDRTTPRGRNERWLNGRHIALADAKTYVRGENVRLLGLINARLSDDQRRLLGEANARDNLETLVRLNQRLVELSAGSAALDRSDAGGAGRVTARGFDTAQGGVSQGELNGTGGERRGNGLVSGVQNPLTARSVAASLAPAEGAAADGATSTGTTAPVQPDRGVASDDAGFVQERAARGVEGSGTELPHLGTIQMAFGHHDVRDVRAHVGGGAAEAARDIGAAAYATGDDVAFGGTPDLRQAAHEAAHVVQQRGGVRLDGGVGRSGDPYEQHADAVADRVVRGESAEALLDTMAHRGATGGRAVQRWRPPGSTAAQTQLSDDGFIVVGERIQIERLWYEQYYLSNTTECNRLILTRLSEGPYPWISDLSEAELVSTAGEMRLAGSGVGGNVEFDTGTDTRFIPISHTLFVNIGLPPGTTFIWEFPSGPDAEPPPAEAGDPPAAPVPTRTSQLIVNAAEYVERDGRRRFTPALSGQMLDSIESVVGATALPAMRGRLMRDGTWGGTDAIARGAWFSFSRANMVTLFGEGAWAAFERSRSADGLVDSTGSDGNVTVDPAVSSTDQEFARRLLEEIYGGREGEGSPMRITGSLIAVLRQIDEHAQRDRIIAALRAGGGTPSSDDPVANLREAMNRVDMSAEYERLGITPEAGEATRREFPWPVEGRIVNHTDLLFTGKEGAFSVDVTSRDVPVLLLLPAWVHVHWVIRASSSAATSAPTIATGFTSHRPIIDAPERFEHAFDEVGTYEVNAIVDHDHYEPNHFTIFVEVRTREERFAEVSDRAFTDELWGETDAATDVPDHEFLGAGADTHDMGRIYEGLMMPLECGPDAPIPDHLAAIDRRIEEVQAYIDSGRAGSDEITWATGYLETMRETRATISGEVTAGAQFLFVEGAYLSHTDRGSSQTLQVVANAQREGTLWRVTIHDTTQAFDNRNSRFSETDETFAHAAERAFTELAKSYPVGMATLRIEALDSVTGQPNGRFIGFELECTSTWEEVRSVVYHPAVMMAVNIAGAAVSIFAPPLGVWIVPTLIAYNAVDTVAGMVDLGARGALEISDVAIGIGQIAIDVIPYVGQATRLVRIGTTVYRVCEGLELLGEVVLMTAQLSEQVQTVRFGYMRQAAEMQADIRSREAANPSDPDLPRLREELARLEEAARDQWVTAIGETAIQQGMMRASMHVVHGMHAAHVADVDASRLHLDTEVASRGATGAATAADLPHIERVMGVPVTRSGSGDGVHIDYDVSAMGGITNVRMVVGEGASLSTIMHHERTLTAMRRYEGVTGSLHNLLDRVSAFVSGGGHVPPGSRAFEARFELEKLPPIIRSLHTELTGRPLDDAARTRIEGQITSLEAQLATHARALDDLAPGLGYVAAGDTMDTTLPPRTDADDGAVMGPHARPPSTGGTATPIHGADIPAPPGRDAAAHARLAAERGGAGRSLPMSERGNRWTGAREADFRYGGAVASALPPEYHWSSDGAGNPIVVRNETIVDGAPVPRRGFDPAVAERLSTIGEGPLSREDIDAMFPLRSDDVDRARYRVDGAAIGGEPYAPSAGARAEMDAIGDRRLAEMDARDHADGEVERLSGELNVRSEDLSSDSLDDTLARLRREHAGDPEALARIDELERHRRALTDARRELVRASESLGNTVTMDYMSGAHASHDLLYGDPSRPGRPGEFDFIYVERNAAGEITSIIVVEAKGASSGLGTRDVAGRAREQGSPAYLDAIAGNMRTNDGSPLDLALEAIIDRGAPGGPDVRYILVEAPVDSTGNPLPPVVSEFDISS